MATARQIQANRNNARKSTGPRTEAGKAASSRNALRHGLFRSVLRLDPDEAQGYDELHRSMSERFRPAEGTG